MTIWSLIKKVLHIMVQNILWYLPPVTAHNIFYYLNIGKRLDLAHPKDFNEKIHYLILFKHGDLETRLTDKLLVRQYVAEKGYSRILTKLFAVYDNVAEIDITKLPNQFVLKTNHDCGTVFICREKETFDLESCKNRLQKSLLKNYAKKALEYHYSKIKPLIICEQYIDDGQGELPIDYKFFCFHGIPDCVAVCTERAKDVKFDYYNQQWNYLAFAKPEHRNPKRLAKPKNFSEMVKIAADLSAGHRFVRVDLYNADGVIYFSELTFTPAGGCAKDKTCEVLNYFGSLIDID